MHATREGPIRPQIAVLQERPEGLARLLDRRFGREYEVTSHTGTADLLGAVERAAPVGRPVALIFADHVVEGETTLSALAPLRDVDAAAVRCVLVPFGDSAASGEVVAAIDAGQVDRYLSRRGASPTSACTRLSPSC